MNAIDSFGQFCLKLNPAYTELDRIYLRNRVYALVGDTAQAPQAGADDLSNLDVLLDLAVANGAVAGTASARAILGAELMSLATPLPSQVNQRFWALYKQAPRQATDYFYNLSRANNYIQTRAIAKNEAFTAATEYGDMEITVNLSKPEKDPRDIAAAAKRQSSGYPLCQLCMENEGYQGRPDYPARANHRIVRFELAGRQWGFQYSPYAYFNEHAIFLDSVHEPMHISAQTFTNLFKIVTLFPHYFVGSNADLPIVGGSMLAHEHYQGGRHTFAMAKAQVETPITVAGFSDVAAGIVKWPMSVIRLSGSDQARVAAAAEQVRAAWAAYSDPTVNIKATDAAGTRHHTVTPIARRVGNDYQLDIVLRDNNTSATYPDGIFHPHADVQHIKRENIGLIEVMGLAILPARLKGELAEVRKFLLGQPNAMAEIHRPWAEALATKCNWTEANATAQLQQAVGRVFTRVLEDAGVFKRDAAGRAAFARFCAQLV
ncbi:UDP-glucose--hexose-1-phosphate uridylyltransferase [Lacticaseibacillus zhaodongensis]|uniref:UDP-glucose--hexose-1-phosphate uridylyltransferase n=1 Tax=Lacticaseibacillus zhaodongensis TaxID=2668065 RepID=UPI0012D33885|nr:UDP-glucose--hexose-1-phosphate uridylyltransferase [Lacticaseibacillus zhaodongensis]